MSVLKRAKASVSHGGIAAIDNDQIPDLLPPPLPLDDALRLADLAHVGPEEHDQFFDHVRWAMALVWMRDRRALGSPPGNALIRVTKAARTLHKEFGKLDPIDRKWIERLWRRTQWYN